MLKKLFGGIAALALIAGVFVVTPADASHPEWDISGNYVMSHEYDSTFYAHDVSLAQAPDGSLTGSGTSGSGTYMYTLTSGDVTGNSFSFSATYSAAPDAAGTVLNVSGTINPDGSLTGTWSDNYQGGSRTGGLSAPAGTAEAITTPDTTNTVEVSGNTAAGENMDGWLFNRDATTSTPYEFNDDQVSIGDGSLYVMPIGSNPSDKFIAELFLNEEIANVDDISYDFLIAGNGDSTDASQFYMNVYALYESSLDDKYYDCRYDVVPTTGSTSTFTTVTFDPSLEYPVTTSGSSPVSGDCPASPADMGDGATIRAIAINVGDTSISDQGLAGYLDNVVVDLHGSTTTYDFEPVVVEPPVTTPTNKDQCKNDGWKTFTNPTFKNQGQCVSYVNGRR